MWNPVVCFVVNWLQWPGPPECRQWKAFICSAYVEGDAGSDVMFLERSRISTPKSSSSRFSTTVVQQSTLKTSAFESLLFATHSCASLNVNDMQDFSRFYLSVSTTSLFTIKLSMVSVDNSPTCGATLTTTNAQVCLGWAPSFLIISWWGTVPDKFKKKK